MKYLAVLGRMPELSLAELEAQFGDSVRKIGPSLAVFEADSAPDINRFGGIMKFGQLIESSKPAEYVASLFPEGKIVLGVSDYGKDASAKKSQSLAMKFKKILVGFKRKVRVVTSFSSMSSSRAAFPTSAGRPATHSASQFASRLATHLTFPGALSTATAHHNQLGVKPGHVELIKVGKEWYLGLGVQNITAYGGRDQARPARDAKVGMLPPKLAQILINLCGPLPQKSRILDPFCGTGVVLQEALLMGYLPVGTDKNERMVEYSKKNLNWLLNGEYGLHFPGINLKAQQNRGIFDVNKSVKTGDATVVSWQNELKTEISKKDMKTGAGKIDAVACETYLGSPMSVPPAEIKLKTEKSTCKEIIMRFLKNLTPQIGNGTPVVLAVPAWLRPDGTYSRLNILDEITDLGYNVVKFKSVAEKSLLYYREGQVVAREIIVLRKK